MTKITLMKMPGSDLTTIVQRIKNRNKAYTIDTGKDLLKAKAMLKHVEFGPWLMANFGWSNSTAQNFMNAAKLAEENPIVVNLKPSAVMALAAPGTPETVKSELLADLDAGKVPTPKEIKTKIAAAKPAKATVAKQAKTSELASQLQEAGLDAVCEALELAFPNAVITVDLVSPAVKVA